MNGYQRVARFIVETSWHNLPPEVQRKARMCVMDDLAAAVSGARTEVSRIAAEFAAARLPGGWAALDCFRAWWWATRWPIA